MTTQIVFKVDQKLKTKAMKKAQEQGMTLSTVMKLITQSFVAGNLRVSLSEPQQLNADTQK